MNCSMATLNESETNWGFTSMYLKHLLMNCSSQGMGHLNMSTSRSNWPYFCILASLAFLFTMFVNGSNVQAKQYQSPLILIYHKLTNYSVRYFVTMLIYFSSAPFYTDNVHLPHNHFPVPPEIQENPKFFPFFKDTLGAVDDTHINCNAMINKQLMIAKGL